MLGSTLLFLLTGDGFTAGRLFGNEEAGWPLIFTDEGFKDLGFCNTTCVGLAETGVTGRF
jgi:hypothetical protein